MAIKAYRPMTPAQRQKTTQDFDQITTKKPMKSLVRAKKQQAGKNNQGRITVRHRGGGVKRHYRKMTYNLPKDLTFTVEEIEYDPNRSARIARVKDENGTYYYVLADNERHFALRITTQLNDGVPASGDLAGVAMWWRADDCIRTPDQFERLRKSIMNAQVKVPSQKKFSAGNEFECYVMTPENVKLGIKGTFAKKKYYDRYIYFDQSPEYVS